MFSVNCNWVSVNHFIFLNKEKEVVFLTFFAPGTRCEVTQCQEVRFVHKTVRKFVKWKVNVLEERSKEKKFLQ